MKGREEVIQFLTKKWQKENGYRLRKELFAWTDNKIAVQVRPFDARSQLCMQWITLVRCSSGMSGMKANLMAASSGTDATV